MMQKELFLLWNHASVKVMDVRHQIVQPGEKQRFDPLPSSVFLYFIRGRAEVLLDELAYSVRSFHVIHGGKGLTLEITACENDAEYYILFYKAVISLPCRQEIMQLLERRNWFLAPYAFIPQQSVALFDQVEKLHAVWQANDADPVRQLRARGLFQLFVSELLRQMDEEARGYGKADLVSQAKQFIHTHYSKPITLETMAKSLPTAFRICPGSSSSRRGTARSTTSSACGWTGQRHCSRKPMPLCRRLPKASGTATSPTLSARSKNIRVSRRDSLRNRRPACVQAQNIL
ncbi:hypothetical protein ABE205_20840 [Brevibacillus agri]